VHMGTAAYTRAEILRQRVLRGDLRDSQRHLPGPPSRQLTPISSG
jgi:hypothetical protein